MFTQERIESRRFEEIVASHHDSSKSVIIIGGGSTEDLETAINRSGGEDNVVIVMAGSAANRLNKAKQTENGYPYVETAHAVVLNGVDDGNQPVYYEGLAEAVSQHDDIDVYLASYNGLEAYQAFSSAIRVKGIVQGLTEQNGDAQKAYGLGSTAPTAALKIFMELGHTNFKFVGVDAGELAAVPQDLDFESAVQTFEHAATGATVEDEGGKQKRYQEYEMPETWQTISEARKCLVYAGDDKHAIIPIGQWYTLEELARLIEWGRENSMSFEFSNPNSVSYAAFMQGHTIQLVHEASQNVAPRASVGGLDL